jgi:adenylate cyclase
LWAEKYDGALEDVFDLQDRITAGVAGAIEPSLEHAEIRRAERKPTTSLDAYDCVLRAIAEFRSFTHSGFMEALAFCRKAIELDPKYTLAYAMAARSIALHKATGTLKTPELEKEGLRFVSFATELGADDPTVLWMTGHALVLLSHDYDRGLDLIDRSLAINPNSAQAWSHSGWLRFNVGEGNAAIEHFERAMRLSPVDPLAYQSKAGIAWGHFVEGRYQDAANWAEKAASDQPKFNTSLRCRLAANGLLGRTETAREALHALLQMEPDATVTKLRKLMPLKRAEHMAAYLDGLRKGGLPE